MQAPFGLGGGKVDELIRDRDLARLATSPVVNYLHHGQALELWPHLLPKWEGPVAKLDLLRYLDSCSSAPSGLESVIRGYLPLRKKIPLGEFRQSLLQSTEWRKLFQALDCRGFSYELDIGMGEYNRQWGCGRQLAARTNLRMALMTARKLFYPPRIKSCLREVSWYHNHYFGNGMPSIAFCFGAKTAEAWYVFVMQSDLASRGPSCLREHFRGWRKILFANVVARAQGRTGAVYLCRAEDVARVCASKGVWRTPDRWRTIYDATAGNWEMPLVKVREPVNVQIYPAKEPVWAEYFFQLPLRQVASLERQQEAVCTKTP